MVDPLLVTTLAVIIGAILNTLRGYMNSEGESYSIRKLLGALIVSAFAGLVVAQTIGTVGLGVIELVLIGLSVGFSVDFAVSKAKKEIAQ